MREVPSITYSTSSLVVFLGLAEEGPLVEADDHVVRRERDDTVRVVITFQGWERRETNVCGAIRRKCAVEPVRTGSVSGTFLRAGPERTLVPAKWSFGFECLPKTVDGIPV